MDKLLEGKEHAPIWCSKCNAMLPDGTEKCPVCGNKLGNDEPTPLSQRELLILNIYVIGMALIPVIIILLLGMVVILLWR